MLMINYLQRFLFKWKILLLIILILSVTGAIISFQADRWLPRYALSSCDLITRQFQTKISFTTVHYHFPDYIIFKDVRIFSPDDKHPMLQASRVRIGFFNNIVADDMVINFPVLKNYWDLHGKEISARARAFHQKNMHLVIPNGRFYPKSLPLQDPIAFKIDLRLIGDHLNAHGSWGDQDKFNYELNGNINGSGFDLDKLTLKNSRSSTDLWGSWHDNAIDWKGFIFYDTFYILDINGSLNIQDNDIILKQLSFSVNGDAAGALGHCTRQGLFQCDADIAFKDLNLHLHAQNTTQGLFFNGAADLDGAHMDFEGLNARIINGNSLRLKINKIQSIFPVKDSKYNVPLENLLANFNFDGSNQKTITLSTQMFSGHCYSRIFLNTSSFPWQIKGQGSFDGIDTTHGLLSGTFKLRSSKSLELSGTLALHNGKFDNTDFQAWAAKTLQMPSLDHIAGAELSCRFKIDGKSKMIENLKLNTDDFGLSGSFHLDADDLVSSQGSVRFSKELLNESPIGRHIIGLVRGAWTLPFEFSLSGDMYRMNFQWDNSPLKNKVRQHLFSFFERMIDRRMDAHPYYKVTIPNESVSPG